MSTVDQIEEFLSRIGKTKSFHLVYGRGKNNKHKGYGFVEFERIQDMKTALLESGKFKLDNRKIYFSRTKSTTDVKTKMGCWFCLDNPEADKSLVMYENDSFYLALDKGPIDDFHFLVVPTNHKKCYLALDDLEKKRLKEIETDLKDFYLSEKRAYVKYERYFKLSESVSHMLTHFISLPLENYSSLDLMFKSNVRDTRMEFFEIKENEKIEDFVSLDKFYIHMSFNNPQTGESKNMLCVMSEALVSKLPFDFMRQFVCSIMNRQDRIDWKRCTNRKQEEIEFIGMRIKKFLMYKELDRKVIE